MSTPSSPSLKVAPNTALPSSFGHVSQLMPSKSGDHASSSHLAESSKQGTSSIPKPAARHLRPRQSTSLETSRQSSDSTRLTRSVKKAYSGTNRPIITVSAAPPTVEEEVHAYSAPRNPPSPPMQRFAPMQSYSRQNDRDTAGSPESVPSSPTSPRSVQFSPRLPAGDSIGKRSQRSSGYGDLMRAHTELSTDDTLPSRMSVSSSSSARDAFLFSGRISGERIRKQTSTVSSIAKLKQEKTAPHSSPRGVLEPSSGSVSPEQQAPRSPVLSSRIPGSSSPIKPRGAPVPLLTTFRRSQRISPPTDPPPSVQQSTPVSDPEENGQAISAIPTIPSIASRMSVGQVHQLVFRQRANTVSSVGSASTLGHSAGRSVTDTPSTPASERFAFETDTEGPRTPTVETDPSNNAATVAHLREEVNVQNAKYQRLSAYLLTLSERHAVEKHELMRRIEVLEREAQKREREMTGLRWLVMNAGRRRENGSRSESPSFSASESNSPPAGTAAAPGNSPLNGEENDQRGMSIDSTLDSMEEGLFELQKSVSDLIAPFAQSPPGSDAIASPAPSVRSSRSAGQMHSRLRRSNTLPNWIPKSSPPGSTEKQARLANSPTLPATYLSGPGLGLDMDIPSIPSLSETDAGSMTPATLSSGSGGSFLPTLTAANTASSGLSAIPETPRSATFPEGRGAEQDGASDTERGKSGGGKMSRAAKRLSTASTSSRKSATAGYEGNLRLGASPSIGQILDRATEKESNMDSVLRKLRSYRPG
ncbi:uncharacterized protein FIBRA_05182 [Fibroporia radiculosa]|uniref:Uncharacterized protein n=1 Tax=Fibroporia radiculosa TaxID=599839 RepID=J4HX33_9APHY|nr:uncharacterized protein FIBRA_05182 [Fibroporia radiculosa]CCM03062.1 predicted protein [Fibroporia radiculosa]